MKLKIGMIGWYHQFAVGDDVIMSCIKRKFSDLHDNCEFIFLGAIAKDKLSDTMRNLDLILVGGGSIIGRNVIYPLTHIREWADKTSAPLVVFGSGFRWVGKRLSSRDREDLNILHDRASLFGVRGPVSLKYLKRYGCADKVEIIGDPALLFKPDPSINPGDHIYDYDPETRYISTVVRDCNEIQHADNITIAKFHARLLDAVIAKWDARVIFIPFRLSDDPNDSDEKMARQVRNYMKNPGQTYLARFKEYNSGKAASLLSKTYYTIGERLHSLVVSAASGVPFVGYEYQFYKAFDFASQIGFRSQVFKSTDLDIDKWLRKITSTEKNRDAHIERMMAAVNHTRSTLAKFAQRSIELAVNHKKRKRPRHRNISLPEMRVKQINSKYNSDLKREMAAAKAKIINTYYLMAGRAGSSENYEEALAIYRSLKLHVENTHTVNYHLGSVYERTADYKAAKRCFKGIIKLKRGKADNLRAGAYYHLGTIAMAENDRSAARSYFTQCLRLEKSHKAAKAALKSLS